MNTVDWPLYDPARPETLARYAIPEEVRRLVRLPQNTGADGRLAAIWDGLRRHGIGYARAREGSGINRRSAIDTLAIRVEGS